MIRSATKEDVPALVQIYNQAVADNVFSNCDTHGTTVEKFLQHWEADIGRYAVFVWERAANEIVGWGALKHFSARPSDPALAEVAVYVRADARSRGIGPRILRNLVRHAERAGFSTLVAIVLEKNAASIRGCEGCGFRRCAHLPDIATLYENEESIVWLMKILHEQ